MLRRAINRILNRRDEERERESVHERRTEKEKQILMDFFLAKNILKHQTTKLLPR